jgi:Bacterial Ig domain
LPATATIAGTTTYTPAPNYSRPDDGPDAFTFKVNDGVADSAPATVTLDVTAVNDAPVASDGTLTATKGTSTPGMLIATDVEGASLSYEITVQPKKGTVTLNPGTNQFTYVANSNANGNDTFSFRASDGSLPSNTAKIVVTIK